MNFLRTLFKTRDDSNFQEAILRLSNVKDKLELNPKKILFKEIFVTEIHY